jgi:Uma2 family endonuclease
MISKTSQNITTAEQLWAMPNDGNRYELVKGVLTMMSPAGSEHGDVAARILARLVVHVENSELGRTYAAETGFRIATSPDTVRAPDASFVSHARLKTVAPTTGYLPLAPDLVVEVVSPNDSSSDVEAKAKEWIQSGSKVVLVADPSNQTLTAYRDDSQIQVLREGDVFDAGDVCSNWKLAVDDTFRIIHS